MVGAVAAAVLIASGMATRYDPGVADQVIANRARWGQVPASTDPALSLALLECQHIGIAVWLEHGGAVTGPYTVIDCAQEQHKAALQKRGFAVDLSYELARRLGLPISHVKVWDADPRRDRPERLSARRAL